MNNSSNIIWTAKEAAKATGGEVRGDWTATGISIDTRTLCPGDLFVALQGDNGDGHDYIAQALDKGAAAAIVSHIPDNLDENAQLLVVEDTLKAMQDLGQAARHRSAAKIIGVTGSAGKTGTKEMLDAAFGALGQSYASKASHNNHWGVPLSLAGMHEGMDYGIFEIGMNNPGEISTLTKQVKPDIAIITTIADVHMESFEAVQDIANAKAEIFDSMDHGGIAILNRDNEWFGHLKAKAETRGVKCYRFGENRNSDACMIDCLEAANGTRIKADIMGESISFTLAIPGRHIAQNALSVLLAVKLLGGDLQKAAKALEKIKELSGRGQREFLDIGDPGNPVMLIDESYNASPVAMSAAFKVLALIDPGRGGRRIAVLGDMLELGRKGPQYHNELALPLKAANIHLVYTCGTLMKNLHNTLPKEQRGVHKKDSTELAKIVPDVLAPGDVVMVKGSNGSKMDVVVEALRAMPEKFRSKNRETEDIMLHSPEHQIRRYIIYSYPE